MITHFNENVTNKVLELLVNSNYQFVLTGSRFFGIESGDWDFFAVLTTPVLNYLMAMGFEELKPKAEETHYKDSSIGMILRHKDARVDVQLLKTREDFEAKCKVMHVLGNHQGVARVITSKLFSPSDAFRSHVWDMLLALAK